MIDKNICIVGLGYIGLPTAAILADRGAHVIGLDVKEDAVACINRGEIHIVEPFLEGVVRKAVSGGYLRATTTAEPADAFLIAVPTPFKGDHEPDMSYVKAAAEAIAPVLAKGNVVILESTSPVGATADLAKWMSELRPDLKFPDASNEAPDVHIAYCPERVLPGNVLHELVQNDRVIGGITPACCDAATEIYRIFVKGECIKTTAATAELCKLSENSFRDVNIAFANELSIICDRMGVNVWELVRLANRHPRVNILQPGPGVGGHCIAVDPWFIVNSAPDVSHLIRTAREVNDAKPHWVVDKVASAVATHLAQNPGKSANDVTIGCFGLAFKANIDDLRESPSVEIAQELARSHPGKLVAVEPNIDEIPGNLAALGVTLTSVAEAFEACNVIVLLVDHEQFQTITPPVDMPIVDTRGIWTR